MELRPKTLVVDDDDTSRSVFVQIFRRGGYPVLEAKTRADAMRQLHDGGIGLLVAAVLLRTCSGVELAAESLRRNPDLRVILTSASPMERWPETDRKIFDALPRHRCVFLPKPLCVLEMLDAAGTMLRLSEPSAA